MGIRKTDVLRIRNKALNKLREEIGRQKRAHACKRLRGIIEEDCPTAPHFLTPEERKSDSMAVSVYRDLGLI